MEQRRAHVAWSVLALGLATMVALIVASEAQGTLSSLRRIGARGALLLLAVTTLAYVLRALKWHGLVRARVEAPLGPSLAVFVSGLLLSLTPGKVAELWKAYALGRRVGAPTARLVPVVVVERLTDLVAVAALASLALAWLPDAWTLPVAAVALVLLVASVLWRSPWHRLLAWAQRRPRMQPWLHHVEEMFASARALLGPRPLALAIPLSLAAWALEGFTLWIALELLGAPLSMASAQAVFAVGTLAGALSFLPGGIVAAEASMVGLLVLQGVDPATATLATLVVRGVTLWYGVILGGAAFVFTRPRAA